MNALSFRYSWIVTGISLLSGLLLVAPCALSQERNESAHQQAIAYLAYSDDGYWQVWQMTPEGQHSQQLTFSPYDKSRLSWYPDGKYLLVNGLQGTLVQVERTTGKETPISLPLAGMSDAVLSPDGQWIAFSLSTAGSVDDNNLWVVDAHGGQPRKLTQLPYLQHDPTWSPDGSTLYFLSGKGDQNHDIWKVSLRDGATTQLTVGQLYHFDIAVDPEGRLAYSSNQSGNYEIWLQSPGEPPRRLTDDPALDAHPYWSPDGRDLVFESTRDGVPNIWRLPISGGDPKPLTHHARGARMPVWWTGDRP